MNTHVNKGPDFQALCSSADFFSSFLQDNKTNTPGPFRLLHCFPPRRSIKTGRHCVCLCVDVCVCEIVRLNEPRPGGKFHAGAAAILVQKQAGGFLWALEDCVLIKQLIGKCLILERSHKFAFFALFLNPFLH